jgi:hypothetical protein
MSVPIPSFLTRSEAGILFLCAGVRFAVTCDAAVLQMQIPTG